MITLFTHLTFTLAGIYVGARYAEKIKAVYYSIFKN
jgi:hypothetical protein